MPSTSMGSGLFFINKSQQSISLSKSLPTEQAAIQRFVQTGRARKRDSKHTRTLRTQTATSRPFQESTTLRTKDDELPDASRGNHNTKIVCSRLKSRNASCERPSTSEIFQNAPALLPTLVCRSVSCDQDPFDTAPIPIDKSVADLLHYYVYYYHPSQWPNEMALLRHGVYFYQNSVSKVMKDAIASTFTMSCILAAAASRLQFVDHIPCSLVKGTESSYLQNASHLIAGVLALTNLHDSDQLEQYVTCVGLLGAAEYYRGNVFAANTHLNAIRWLLTPRGGITAIKDECLRGQIAMSDLALACFELRPCHFACCYDPGPASVLGLSDDELQGPTTTCTATFLLQRPTMIIPSGLRLLIGNILESYTVKTRAVTSAMPVDRAVEITHWLTLRNMAIRNKLLAIETIDPRTQALRVALVMWTLLSMSITGRAKTIKIMAPKLKTTLSRIPSTEWSSHEDLKLWITMLGAQCASADSNELLWFTSNCLSLSISDCSSSQNNATGCVSDLTERLEAFQHNFLYDATIQRHRTRALAEKLQRFLD